MVEELKKDGLLSLGTFFHVLKDNKTTQMPNRLIIYDVETRCEIISEVEEKHHFKLCVACYMVRRNSQEPFRKEYKVCYTPQDFWDFVESKGLDKRNIIHIAHNQHFDFIVSQGFLELPKRGWNISRPILSANLFIMKAQNGAKTLRILDSLNWFKFSIKQIGDFFEVPKGEIDFNTCSDLKLLMYCKRDVDITCLMVESWLEFIYEHDLGTFKFTTASQAMQAFRHRFMSHKIYVHANDHITKLERDSYRGGRCEAFFMGTKNEHIIDLDVNSLYPFVMGNNDFPCKYIKRYANVSIDFLRDILKDYCVIARVKVKTDENVFGYKDERLLFPIGIFWQTLCTPELIYGLDHNFILEIDEMAVYEKAPLFTEFVDFFNGLKEKYKREQNTIYTILAKNIGTNLYGKFGQRNEQIIEVGNAPIDSTLSETVYDHDSGVRYTQWAFGGKIYIKLSTPQESSESCVYIASHVTAYARMHLWSIMQKAGLKNVFYCDTDSVFVNEEGYNNLADKIDEIKLGYLKVEAEDVKLTVFGAKDYKFGELERIKGIKKTATKLSENKYVQDQFLKFRSLLRLGNLDSVIVKKVTKELKRIYKKGIVQNNGIVTPIPLL